MSASHQSICKVLAPAPQSFISQILFCLKSSMYDQEQQFTVFSWLNKNIRGVQVVPSEPDSLDWPCGKDVRSRKNWWEVYDFGSGKALWIPSIWDFFFQKVSKCVYTAGCPVPAWSLSFVLPGYLQMCFSLPFSWCILFSWLCILKPQIAMKYCETCFSLCVWERVCVTVSSALWEKTIQKVNI